MLRPIQLSKPSTKKKNTGRTISPGKYPRNKNRQPTNENPPKGFIPNLRETLEEDEYNKKKKYIFDNFATILLEGKCVSKEKSVKDLNDEMGDSSSSDDLNKNRENVIAT